MRQLCWIFTAAAMATTCAMAATATQPAPTHTAARSASGIDLAGIDHSVLPGNDFDNYANGSWKKTAEIPADRSSTGIFLQVFQKAEKRNADLIQALASGNAKADAGTNNRKIGDYYTAFMDEATIEKRGLEPLQPELKAIEGIQSKTDLARVLGAGLRADVDPVNATNFHTERLFGLFVSHGLDDATRNIPYLLQGGLGMPTRDYYLSDDKAMVETRGKYQAYVAALLKQAGIADADAKASAILALETKIAKAQVDIVDSQDIHKANNPWPMASFAKNAPGLDWNAYFKAAGLDQQKIVDVWQVPAIKALSALTASEPLQSWKDYLAFHALNQSASLLPKSYADLSFGFYGQALSGTPKQRDRWKRAVASTNNALGDAVGKLYVDKYFPASSKQQVEQMVKNILAAFDERVDHLDWMTPATREKAKAKIASIRVSVGYPETWRDYGKLEIRPDDALGNQQRAEKYEYDHQLAKLGQPVDRGEWWMTPQTVNAVNLPLQNALNFPAAILEAPFFDPKADAAANYGSIGAVIGHEISHSFDNLGAEFDAQGNLANWWTPEDQAHFKAAGQKLVEQYNAYEALPGLHVNGQQTLGENIADVSGLTIAYVAYHKSLGGKPAPVVDGLTGDQRFFLAFGQSWREKIRDAAMRQRVIGNEHAPGRFRAQTVRNLDGWYDAFQPKAGETLYLAPADRVKIW